MKAQVEIIYNSDGLGKEIIFHADRPYSMPYSVKVIEKVNETPGSESFICFTQDNETFTAMIMVVDVDIDRIDFETRIYVGDSYFVVAEKGDHRNRLQHYCVLCGSPMGHSPSKIVCKPCYTTLITVAPYVQNNDQLLADCLYTAEALNNVGGMLSTAPFCVEHNASIDYALREKGFVTRWNDGSKLLCILEFLLA